MTHAPVRLQLTNHRTIAPDRTPTLVAQDRLLENDFRASGQRHSIPRIEDIQVLYAPRPDYQRVRLSCYETRPFCEHRQQVTATFQPQGRTLYVGAWYLSVIALGSVLLQWQSIAVVCVTVQALNVVGVAELIRVASFDVTASEYLVILHGRHAVLGADWTCSPVLHCQLLGGVAESVQTELRLAALVTGDQIRVVFAHIEAARVRMMRYVANVGVLLLEYFYGCGGLHAARLNWCPVAKVHVTESRHHGARFDLVLLIATPVHHLVVQLRPGLVATGRATSLTKAGTGTACFRIPEGATLQVFNVLQLVQAAFLE